MQRRLGEALNLGDCSTPSDGKVIGVDRSAVVFTEHERVWTRLTHAELHTELKLLLAVFPEIINGSGRQRYVAPAVLCLRWLEPVTGAPPSLSRVRSTLPGRREINVLPPQGQQLPSPHAVESAREDNGEKIRASQSLEGGRNFFGTQDINLLSFRPPRAFLPRRHFCETSSISTAWLQRSLQSAASLPCGVRRQRRAVTLQKLHIVNVSRPKLLQLDVAELIDETLNREGRRLICARATASEWRATYAATRQR